MKFIFKLLHSRGADMETLMKVSYNYFVWMLSSGKITLGNILYIICKVYFRKVCRMKFQIPLCVFTKSLSAGIFFWGGEYSITSQQVFYLPISVVGIFEFVLMAGQCWSQRFRNRLWNETEGTWEPSLGNYCVPVSLIPLGLGFLTCKVSILIPIS